MEETLSNLYDKTEEAGKILEQLLHNRGKIRGTKEIFSKWRIARCGIPHDTSPSIIDEKPYVFEFSPAYLRSIEYIFSEIEAFNGDVNFAQISGEILKEDFLLDNEKKLILRTNIEFEDGKALTLEEYRNVEVQPRTKKHSPRVPNASRAVFNEKGTEHTGILRADGAPGKNSKLYVEKDIVVAPPRPVSQRIGYLIELSDISIDGVYLGRLANTEELESFLAEKYLGGQNRKLFESISNAGAFSAYVRQMPDEGGGLAGVIRGKISYEVGSEESYGTIKIKDVTKRLDEIGRLISQAYASGLIEEMNEVLFL